MSHPMTVKEVLQGALKLIEGGWTRGRYVKTRGSRKCYCAMGAIRTVTPSYRLRADAYDGVHPEGDIVTWNDTPGRKKSEVVAAFKRAIAAQPTEVAA